jgi:hypothetical protein
MVTVPIAPGAERAPPFAVVAAVVGQEPGRTDHRPAVWSDEPPVAVARAVLVAPVVVWAALVARALGAARRGAVVTAFCLPARPGSRRYCRSP